MKFYLLHDFLERVTKVLPDTADAHASTEPLLFDFAFDYALIRLK